MPCGHAGNGSGRRWRGVLAVGAVANERARAGCGDRRDLAGLNLRADTELRSDRFNIHVSSPVVAWGQRLVRRCSTMPAPMAATATMAGPGASASPAIAGPGQRPLIPQPIPKITAPAASGTSIPRVEIGRAHV